MATKKPKVILPQDDQDLLQAVENVQNALLELHNKMNKANTPDKWNNGLYPFEDGLYAIIENVDSWRYRLKSEMEEAVRQAQTSANNFFTQNPEGGSND